MYPLVPILFFLFAYFIYLLLFIYLFIYLLLLLFFYLVLLFFYLLLFFYMFFKNQIINWLIFLLHTYPIIIIIINFPRMMYWHSPVECVCVCVCVACLLASNTTYCSYFDSEVIFVYWSCIYNSTGSWILNFF